jgi:hypothetical protein
MSIQHLARALITATMLIAGVLAGVPAHAAPASQLSPAACKSSAAPNVPSAAFGHYNEDLSQELYDEARNRAA